MKRFRLKNTVVVPSCHIDDVRSLKRFLADNLGISISLEDMYKVWCNVSDDWDAGWLGIDTCPDGENRGDFLFRKLEEYGVIIDSEAEN